MPEKRPYSRDELLKFTTNALSHLQGQRRKALRERQERMQKMQQQQAMPAAPEHIQQSQAQPAAEPGVVPNNR